MYDRPSINLSAEELGEFRAVRAQIHPDPDFTELIEWLDLLIDESTGEMELTNECCDRIRSYAGRRGYEQMSLRKIFGRTMGNWLDFGFFGD